MQKKTREGTIKCRICTDETAINAGTKPDAYHIPNTVVTLDSLWHNKIFYVRKIASGYHQTTFSSKTRKIRHSRAIDGIINLWKCPLRLKMHLRHISILAFILMTLMGIDCLAYVDDLICCYVAMVEQKLEKIFQRADSRQFQNCAREIYFWNTVQNLGHVVTQDGIKPDPWKVRAIEEYPVPKTEPLLDYLTTCSRFFRNCQAINKFYQRKCTFWMEIRTQRSFWKFETNFEYWTLLNWSWFFAAIFVASDASTKATGTALPQVSNREERPAAFDSGQFNHAVK
jgi:hypothetical protein